MNDITKENYFTKIPNYNNLKNEYYFKKWYMEHCLEWMEGFNEGFKILSDVIKELKNEKT